MKFNQAFMAAAFLLLTVAANAQMKIGNNVLNLNPNSILELEKTNQGFVLPKVALISLNSNAPLSAGSGPLTATVVYDTVNFAGNLPGIYYWDGTKWNALSNGINLNYWNLNGNANTSAGNNAVGNAVDGNYVGTSDVGRLAFGVQSIKQMMLDSLGNIYGGINNILTNGAASNLVWGSGNIDSSSFTIVSGANNIVGPNSRDCDVMGNTNLVNNARNEAAFGRQNFDSAANTLIAGRGNIIPASAVSATVVGQYNYPLTNMLFAVGNGTAANAQNNALTLINTGTTPNFGININTPLKRLHIDAKNSSGAADSLKIDNLASSTTTFNKSILIRDSTTGYISNENIATLGAGSFWALNGNASTKSGTNSVGYSVDGNFIGTTDANALVFGVNNTKMGIVDTRGNFIFGGAADPAAGTISSVASGSTLVNNFLVGSNNTSNSKNGIAIGTGNVINGASTMAMAFGTNNIVGNSVSAGNRALAIGTSNLSTGSYSAALGNTNTASANYAFTQGQGNTASAQFAEAIGESNTASAVHATAIGQLNIASGTESFAIGYLNTSSAVYGKTFGTFLTAGTFNESDFGQYNAFTSGNNALLFDPADPILQVGVGQSAASAQNAFTILKNGQTAIGLHSVKPTATLDVTNGGSVTIPVLKLRTPFSGASTDSILTWNNIDSSIRKLKASSLISNLAWSLTGNAGNKRATNFLGTTDTAALVFKVNNNLSGLIESSSGNYNTFYGYQSGANNSGNSDVFIGYQAGMNGSGGSNIAIGYSALANASGSNNIAIGTNALAANTSGYQNVVSGYSAMSSNTSGGNNAATGYAAMQNNTTGSINVAMGAGALQSNTTASGNTALGASALQFNTSGSSNTATGTQALYSNTIGATNVANGYQSLYSNTAGNGNTASGWYSLYSNTIGVYNTAYGFATLLSNITGNYNTALGQGALFTNLTGNNNVAVGEDALLFNTFGNYLVGLGTNSLYNNSTGTSNTATGESSLNKNTIGNYNTANGAYALFTNTTASNNCAMGYYTLNANTTGANNTAIGYESGINNFTGSNNTMLGYTSGLANTTGSNNTFIGYTADASSNNLTNAGAIGYSAKVSQNNSLVLGGTGANAVNVGIGNTAPNSTLQVSGSVSAAIISTASAYKLSAIDFTVIFTGNTNVIFTLPAANTCQGRMYHIVNATVNNSVITFSLAVYLFNGTTETKLTSNHGGYTTGNVGESQGQNNVTIQSDGTNWWRIN